MTAGGHARLAEELKKLKNVERPAIIKAISEARQLGDLSENAEYHSAREKQGFIEGRILDLEYKLARAEVIDIQKLTGNIIKFGATVTVLDQSTDQEVTYQLVGEVESDIEKGLLSVASPLARALLTKTVGDMVEVSTPRGQKAYEILSVQFL